MKISFTPIQRIRIFMVLMVLIAMIGLLIGFYPSLRNDSLVSDPLFDSISRTYPDTVELDRS